MNSDTQSTVTVATNSSVETGLDTPNPSPSPGEKNEETKQNTSEPLNQKITRHQIILLVEMSFLAFSVTFLSSMLIPALPVIQREHPNEASTVPWVLTSYLLVGAVTTPVVGGLSEIFSLFSLVVITLSLYLVGIFAAGIWGGSSVLNLSICRIFQGFGTPILGYGVVKKQFPQKYISPMLGVISSMYSVGGSMGQLGGSALMLELSYAETFFVVGPLVLIAGIAFLLTLADVDWKSFKSWPHRHSRPSFSNLREPLSKVARLDFLGLFLLSAGSVLFLIALSKGTDWSWKSAKTLSMLIIGIVVFIIFIIFDWFCPRPLLPLKLLANRDMLCVTIVSILFGIYNYSMFETTPYLLMSPIMPFKYTTQLQVGLVIFPAGIAALCTSLFAGFMEKHLGATTVHTFACIIGCVPATFLIKFHNTVAQILILRTISGIYGGMLLSVQMTIMASCCSTHFGSASGVNTFARTLGSAVAPVITNIFLQETVPYTETDGTTIEVTSADGYVHSFIFITVVTLVELVVALCVSNQLFLCRKIAASFKEPEKEIELDILE